MLEAGNWQAFEVTKQFVMGEIGARQQEAVGAASHA